MEGFGRLPLSISVGVGGHPGAINGIPVGKYPHGGGSDELCGGVYLSVLDFTRADSGGTVVPRIATAPGNTRLPQTATSVL